MGSTFILLSPLFSKLGGGGKRGMAAILRKNEIRAIHTLLYMLYLPFLVRKARKLVLWLSKNMEIKIN